MMDKMKSATLAGFLLLAGMALVAVPPAAAHDCSSVTPEGCGVCDASEPHRHYVSYSGKQVMWCFYDGKTPPGAECLNNLAQCLGETRFHIDAPAVPNVEL